MLISSDKTLGSGSLDTLFFSKSITLEFKSLIFFSTLLSLSVKIFELKFENF